MEKMKTYDSSTNAIAKRIRKLRKEQGLTQEEIAKEMIIRRETYNTIEKGKRDLKAAEVVRLADALGTSCDYILKGAETVCLNVQEELGLSLEAIRYLIRCKKRTGQLSYINFFIEHDLTFLLETIRRYLCDDFSEFEVILLKDGENGAPVSSRLSSGEGDCIIRTRKNYKGEPNGDAITMTGAILEQSLLESIKDTLFLMRNGNELLPDWRMPVNDQLDMIDNKDKANVHNSNGSVEEESDNE